MKPLNLILVCLWALCQLTGPARAQSFEESLALTQRFYSESEYLSVLIKTELYTKASDARAERVLFGSFARRNKEYLTNFNGKILIQNSRCALVVDMANKYLLYSKPMKEDESQRNLLNEFANADSLAKASVTIKPVSGAPGTKGFEIVPKRIRPGTGEPAKTVLTLNANNHSLQSVVYIHPPHPAVPYERIVIRYTHRIGEQYVPKDSFSEAKYVNTKNGKTVPTPEYQEFKVVQQDKKDLQTF